MIDLHLHLDGSLNPKNMLWMAEMSGVKLSFTEENELKKQIKAVGFDGSVEEFCQAVSSGRLRV